MQAILGLILIGLFAYLGSTLYQLKNLPDSVLSLLSSGLGFFVLGLLLGPHAVNLIDQEALGHLDLVIDLGVGLVGLLFGLQFNRHNLVRIPIVRYVAALSESLWTFIWVVCGLILCLRQAGWIDESIAWMVLVALAAIASTTSPTTSAQLDLRLRSHGPIRELMQTFSGLDAVPAIVILGIALCFSPVHTSRYGFVLDGLFWTAVCLALGLLIGALAHLLTLYRYNDNQLLVIVLSLVVLSGGAAHYVVVSPLFVNFIVGLVLANRSPIHLRFLRLLMSVEKPIYLILLTLVGARWNLPAQETWWIILLFVVTRLFGKWSGGWLACRIAAQKTRSWFGVGPGLVPHGGMALALALTFQQFVTDDVADVVITATISSMLFAALVSPFLLSRLLHREGEVP